MHCTRARLGKDGSTITQADRDLFLKVPSVCQYPTCDSTSQIAFCKEVGHKRYYCGMHYRRVKYGIDMDQPKPRKAPKSCQYIYTSGQACAKGGKLKYVDLDGHQKYYCSMHSYRAENGQDMDAPCRRPRTTQSDL